MPLLPRVFPRWMAPGCRARAVDHRFEIDLSEGLWKLVYPLFSCETCLLPRHIPVATSPTMSSCISEACPLITACPALCSCHIMLRDIRALSIKTGTSVFSVSVPISPDAQTLPKPVSYPDKRDMAQRRPDLPWPPQEGNNAIVPWYKPPKIAFFFPSYAPYFPRWRNRSTVLFCQKWSSLHSYHQLSLHSILKWR